MPGAPQNASVIPGLHPIGDLTIEALCPHSLGKGFTQLAVPFWAVGPTKDEPLCDHMAVGLPGEHWRVDASAGALQVRIGPAGGKGS